MYCSYLLLLSILAVFSNINAASVHKRGIIPSNINIDINLGKESTAKNAAAPPPANGSRKTVLTAPFGLASLTITTNRKNSSTGGKPIAEPEKPCNPESENIAKNNNMKTPSGTLGGKGDAFFGPPHPPPHDGFGSHSHHPHPDFGPPPHDFHHPHHHYPPPPSHHHPFDYPPPPPPHHHYPGCHHEEPFPAVTSYTKDPKIPENKPDAKFTTVPVPVPSEKVSQGPNTQSTTDNIDSLIGDIFGGSNSLNPTTMKTNIDINNPEQTGEGNMDIRMPKNRRQSQF